MLQRGKKTSGNLAALTLTGDPLRPKPPSFLTTRERRLFTEIIDACDPRHFRAQDLPMLSSYVQTCFLVRTAVKYAAHDPKMLTVWEKAARMQMALATKLRLTPQARTDPRTLARKSLPPVGPRPWEDHE